MMRKIILAIQDVVNVRTVLRNFILLIGAVNSILIFYLMYKIHCGVYKIDLAERYEWFRSPYDFNGQTFLFIILMSVVICVLVWILILYEENKERTLFVSMCRFVVSASLIPLTGYIIFLPYKLSVLHIIPLGLDTIAIGSVFVVTCIHTYKEKFQYFLDYMVKNNYKFKPVTSFPPREDTYDFAALHVKDCNSFEDVRFVCDNLIKQQLLEEQKAREAARALAESKAKLSQKNSFDLGTIAENVGDFVSNHPYLVLLGVLAASLVIFTGYKYFSMDSALPKLEVVQPQLDETEMYYLVAPLPDGSAHALYEGRPVAYDPNAPDDPNSYFEWDNSRGSPPFVVVHADGTSEEMRPAIPAEVPYVNELASRVDPFQPCIQDMTFVAKVLEDFKHMPSLEDLWRIRNELDTMVVEGVFMSRSYIDRVYQELMRPTGVPFDTIINVLRRVHCMPLEGKPAPWSPHIELDGCPKHPMYNEAIIPMPCQFNGLRPGGVTNFSQAYREAIGFTSPPPSMTNPIEYVNDPIQFFADVAAATAKDILVAAAADAAVYVGFSIANDIMPVLEVVKDLL